MRFSIYLLFIGLFLLAGCSKDNNPVISELENGTVSLKIDRENAPSSVVYISATLTRTNYQPIVSELNLLSDSTADLNLIDIPAGQWHLKVDAMNQYGKTEYTGETDITIVNNVIIQVTLTLYPVPDNTGGIYLFVTWGDQSGWKDAPENPVLTTSQNPSNPLYVTAAVIIYDNGVYKMWYNAIYNNAVASVWYAESPDGKSWNTVGTRPVLTKGEDGNWDSYSLVVTTVIKEDSLYRMYYAGGDAHPYQSLWKTGLAVSRDGKNWTKHPRPVLSGNEYIAFTGVVKNNNTYYGYFGYNNSIGVATSPDGINWEYYSGNPILLPSLPWEGDQVTYPAVVMEGGKFKMFYSNLNQTAIGYAESGNPFSFMKKPVPEFTREQSINKYDWVSYVAYINTDKPRIYYTGDKYDYSPLNGICYIYK